MASDPEDGSPPNKKSRYTSPDDKSQFANPVSNSSLSWIDDASKPKRKMAFERRRYGSGQGGRFQKLPTRKRALQDVGHIGVEGDGPPPTKKARHNRLMKEELSKDKSDVGVTKTSLSTDVQDVGRFIGEVDGDGAPLAKKCRYEESLKLMSSNCTVKANNNDDLDTFVQETVFVLEFDNGEKNQGNELQLSKLATNPIRNVAKLLLSREIGQSSDILEKCTPVIMFRGEPNLRNIVDPKLLDLPVGPIPLVSTEDSTSTSSFHDIIIPNNNNHLDEEEDHDVLYDSESEDGTENEQVRNAIISTTQTFTQDIKKGSGNWLKLGINERKQFQVGVADELVYCSFACRLEPLMYIQNFYAFTPGTFEFKLLMNQQTSGRILKAKMLKYADGETEQHHTQLIVLNEGNELLAYDIKSRPPRLIERKTLTHLSGGEGGVNEKILSSFTDIAILYKERKIIVMRREENSKNVRTILILPFPSVASWNYGSLIRVDIPDMKLKVIKNDDTVMITSDLYNCTIGPWSNIMNTAVNVTTVVATTEESETNVRILDIWSLDRLPQNEISLSMPTHNFQYLGTNRKNDMGLLHGNVGSQIKFFPIVSTGEASQEDSKLGSVQYAKKSVYGYRAFEFSEEMDGSYYKSSRILLCNPEVGDQKIVTFTRGENGNIRSQQEEELFNTEIGTEVEGTKLLMSGSKTSVLTLARCSMGNNVIAVLFGQNNLFQVKLYNSKGMILERELEVVSRGEFDSIALFTNLKKATMKFNEKYLLVNLVFRDGIYDDKREVYCRRFCAEENVGV